MKTVGVRAGQVSGRPGCHLLAGTFILLCSHYWPFVHRQALDGTLHAGQGTFSALQSPFHHRTTRIKPHRHIPARAGGDRLRREMPGASRGRRGQQPALGRRDTQGLGGTGLGCGCPQGAEACGGLANL